MPGCDRCGSTSGIAIFSGCQQCGPIPLCIGCEELHEREIVDEPDLMTPELLAEFGRAATTAAERLKLMSEAALDAYAAYCKRVQEMYR